MVEKSLRYDIKGKKYVSPTPKYYFEDLGLRNARLNFRQIDQGHLLENLIYNELRRRGISVDVGQINGFEHDDNGKTNRRTLEIDFVCNSGFRRYYIQSVYQMPSYATIERELRSLRTVKDDFQKIVIAADDTPTHQEEGGIVILNIFDFLLDKSEFFKIY